MKIIIRVDASLDIGSGHVIRCLTLAEKLKLNGHNVEFICREVKGNLIEKINKRGFFVNKLPKIEEDIWSWTQESWNVDFLQTKFYLENEKIDLLIVDHYSLDIKWEKCLGNYVGKIMVIDDLANRKHYCDILLDHNYYVNKDVRYKTLVKKDTFKMLGPQFALLKDSFYDKSNDFDDNTILISFGGSDPTNETLKVIKIIDKNFTDKKFKIIVGSNNKSKDEIEAFINLHPHMEYLFNIDTMAEELKKAAFVIGAGGVSALERLALGIPALVITVADNQVEIAQNLAKRNVIKYLGNYNDVDENTLLKSIHHLSNQNNNLLNIMKSNCNSLFPNYNTTEYVVRSIEEQF